ncbi:uncharacterized protein LY89DRAFT_58730 [Mollisia scopiformis]|uniref:Glycosyl transferase family 25 domain-containing protein n=1 Tax=Mollisia scopiformis TaxID=149040 RepID=A0A194XBW7_MOLSC|nr:uncharacterized protein LY89DRAFT_58730 [Mollisia scopiformis]KUJ17655.1 hypothetical protein LY89DRAFT_58730 [Mollisia scopiformis]
MARRAPPICAAILVTLILYTTAQQRGHAMVPSLSSVRNSTLGFELILAVSTGGSWRRDGLLEAAELTGFHIQMPQQPTWADQDTQQFTRQTSRTSGKKLTLGEAGCWLGHLHLLKYIATANQDTALVLEDDVDWDVALKDQLELVSPLIRTFSDTDLSTSKENMEPYGTDWDLLWLGHCGDIIPRSGVQSIYDTSLPVDGIYTESDGSQTRFPQFTRMVHRSVSPICSYGYAVTGHGAMRILALVSSGVDAQVSEQYQFWCKHGNLKCITVNPELFHHHKHAGTFASEIDAVDGWREDSDLEAHSYTINVRNSARCQAQARRGAPCS